MIDVLTEHFDEFASGLWVTTRLVVASFVIALVLGTVVAALRVAPSRWLQRLGALYVEIFRNLPLLVLLFITFAGLRRAGVGIGPWTAGIASLGIYTSAYVAEALRSGVFAVNRGQIEASLSLGFTQTQTLREIVLPQAFRTVVPPLGSITIAMVKNSAIVGASLLALPDLLKQARIVNSNTFQTTESFFWAAVGYMMLTVAVTVRVPHRSSPATRSGAEPMNYLFNPDNWEWLWTGNNARFLLEAFLINLQIALISMVFALAVGLRAGAAVARDRHAGAARRQGLGRPLPQPPADLPDPLPGAVAARVDQAGLGGQRARASCPTCCAASSCSRGSWASSSTTAPCSRRSCARASCRSTAASARRRPRSGSRTATRCAT